MTNKLIGHESAESQLLQEFHSGKFPHGIIIAGPEGIGKRLLADKLAAMLLTCHPERSEGSPSALEDSSPSAQNDNALNRIAAGSHSDFLLIEREYDAKKDDYAHDISVEQARKIGEFLSLTPGESDWRVVIIDSADTLNINASNAILKILEEPPPQAVLLLIAHHPSRLLATIRSRCRLLRLNPLNHKHYLKIMREILPDYGDETYENLGELSDYSPGIALELQKQGASTLYLQLEEIFDALPNLPHASIKAIAEQISTGSVHANFQIFCRLTLHLIAHKAKDNSGEEGHLWAQKWQEAASAFNICEKLHLDTKSVIVSFFHSLNSPEPFLLSA